MYKVISANRAPNKPPKNWRVFEKEMLEKHFGKVLDVNGEDGHSVLDAYNQYRDSVKYIRWYPDPEGITNSEYIQMVEQSDLIGDVPYIGNSAKGFINVQCKEETFKVWRDNDIPVPDFFTFKSKEEFYDKYNRKLIDFPFLIRINSGVNGSGTFLIKCSDEIESGLNDVMVHYNANKNVIKNSMLCVKMIDTIDTYYNVNHSFRVHVSGDRVICGYGRVSSPDDAIAITSKFTDKDKEAWLAYNTLCEKLMVEYEDLFCKAVKVLGLNIQAIDIVLDRDGQPYFLEVQPTYSAGYPDNSGHGYKPPFYHPYKSELVNFIHQNESYIKKEMPRYYYNWLDKNNHFDLVYKTLKENLS
tara:strand:+ start:92 stop:1162 length:1071 start_codon:yes stop_codon:yes gene_type:complete